MRDLFPPAFCRQLLDSVPPAQHFHQLRHRDATQPDGRSARLRLYFYPEQLWFLPAALRIRKMQFLPASGYAFSVQKSESWHSAEMTTPADDERMSILLTYCVQDTFKHWFSRRYDRLLSFLGMPPDPRI